MVGVFDLFTIGIGPSSSHTVGPMRAAVRFLEELDARKGLAGVARVRVELYDSLALTGRGHGTDRAVLLGLSGEAPETVDPDAVSGLVEGIRRRRAIRLLSRHEIAFDEARDVVFAGDRTLPLHANALRFEAADAAGRRFGAETYYSVGGGFVLTESDEAAADDTEPLPYPYRSAAELLAFGRRHGLSIADMVLANERTRSSAARIRACLEAIREAMNACIDRGCRQQGTLPGGLGVERRAPRLYRELARRPGLAGHDATAALDWINLYALAVNEENAAGGRVVTAPTNGAAGVVPAVLRYLEQFCGDSSESGSHVFLLTAAGIGMLYKENASISGAEVGCQGEVGVACSMAAGGLAAALGGSNEQIENAAEIGMEHNLGLTCDPVGGLVQIPCIERNAMGAVKAVNAARLALRGDGGHRVPLDKVIETMRQTGADMSKKYKETARGGLAVNLVAC